MATYYHGAPEIQQDAGGLQTLYLMNPSYAYSDSPPAHQQPSMIFLNSPLNSLNSFPQPHPQHQQQQHFVGIPLQPSSAAHDSPRPPSILTSSHEVPQPIHQYNLWTVAPASANASPIVSPSPTKQGLSLSLPYRPIAEQDIASVDDAKNIVAGSSSTAAAANGAVGLQSVLMGSKYLKAAQQLLDEVVSVGRGSGAARSAAKGSDSASKKSRKDLDGDQGDDGGDKKGAELPTAERQELQMKKAKLVNMLDEVEQRYRQYHHQMQAVVSSFEAVAGPGSARTYTALALQTISRQFRCLRDAISGQIRAASKSLGEEDCLGGGPGGKSVGSRLRFVDHHLRQQRALQQLGMIQHNAWRPQRGLPERAVSVLRAWLFEHFLHPYPKDSDKHMLAKQTGLTRSQVSNWFINARVRLWKPMVEEMYLEETKEQEQNNGGGAGRGGSDYKSEASEHSASKSTSPQANNSTPSRTEQHNEGDHPPIVTIHSGDMGMVMQQRMKKPRNDESLHQHHQLLSQMAGMDMKPDELTNRELLMKLMDQGAGFGAYPTGDIGRFADHEQFAPRFGTNGVSLTLGPPHCETLSLSGSQQQSYLSNESIPMARRLDLTSEENSYFGLNTATAANGGSSGGNNPANAYESINNMQNRKRFAAQLLPDFVA